MRWSSGPIWTRWPMPISPWAGSIRARPSWAAAARWAPITLPNWHGGCGPRGIGSFEHVGGGGGLSGLAARLVTRRKGERRMQLPEKARVVIVGGGVIGCSVAYHLAKLGWKDVVLLERKQLTSGTTWHAAGLIGQLRATANMTKLAKYSQELYGSLEEETGVATGFKRVGSITVALTEERREELYRNAGMARAFGVQIEEISPTEVKAKYPHLNTKGVTGAVYLDKDGQGDPANIALALAKGARQRGAVIRERTRVTGVARQGRRITGVDWQAEDGSSGHITAEH